VCSIIGGITEAQPVRPGCCPGERIGRGLGRWESGTVLLTFAKEPPMTTLIRLNDLQLVLLANAAQRDNGSLLPLPDNGTHDTSHIGRAIASLIGRKFVEERMVTDRALTWLERNDECFGWFITAAGRAAVGIEPNRDDPMLAFDRLAA
jgi:hypothetical protein